MFPTANLHVTNHCHIFWFRPQPSMSRIISLSIVLVTVPLVFVVWLFGCLYLFEFWVIGFEYGEFLVILLWEIWEDIGKNRNWKRRGWGSSCVFDFFLFLKNWVEEEEIHGMKRKENEEWIIILCLTIQHWFHSVSIFLKWNMCRDLNGLGISYGGNALSQNWLTFPFLFIIIL